jgi:hypothetical protein
VCGLFFSKVDKIEMSKTIVATCILEDDLRPEKLTTPIVLRHSRLLYVWSDWWPAKVAKVL